MPRALAVSIVLIHLAVAMLHGAAHSGAQVRLSTFQSIYVWVVIMIGPLVALALILARRRFGGQLLALTMAGSFVFGVVYHFIVVSPDHVSHITSATWRLPFQITAGLLAVIEAIGTWAGAVVSRP